MDEVTLRPLRSDDWPAILILAETSLSELSVVPSQNEWLSNRQSYSQAEGIQQHFVAVSNNQIVGYGCAEHRDNLGLHPPAVKAAEGEYRLFVVVHPSMRATLGTKLLGVLREELLRLGARRAWIAEYEDDKKFIAYLEEKGFVKQVTFNLPDGTRAVRLIMDAPFKTLA